MNGMVYAVVCPECGGRIADAISVDLRDCLSYLGKGYFIRRIPHREAAMLPVCTHTPLTVYRETRLFHTD